MSIHTGAPGSVEESPLSVDSRLRMLSERIHTQVSEGRVHLAKQRRQQGEVLSRQDEELWARSRVKHELAAFQRSCYESPDGQPLDADELDWVTRDVLDQSFAGGRLRRLWDDNPDAFNLLASGSGPTRLEYGGGEVREGPPAADSDQGLYNELRAMASHAGVKEVQWDPTKPELELILPDGSRLTAQRWTTPATFVTIRRPTMGASSLETLVEMGTVSPRLASLLAAIPRADLRYLIAGAMNSGKTVLLRSIAATLPKDAHVITVESQRELLLHENPHVYPRWVTAMESRRPNSEGVGEITMAQNITSIQRMSPDFVLVGEIRGPEAPAFVSALQQGYPVAGTIHAHSSIDAVHNLAQYFEEHASVAYETAMRRAATFVDVTVHMRHLPNGRRVVDSVRLILDYRDGVVRSEELWSPRPDGAAQMQSFTRVPQDFLDRLVAAGYDQRLSDATRPAAVRVVS